MGGFGSGRHSGGPAVEDGLRLDINDLLRKGIIEQGEHRFGSLKWTDTATGEEIASIRFEISLVDPHDAWARLFYSANGLSQDYRIRIASSPCNYGGLRWWWRCPRSGRRVSKLYLPPGASIFASRKLYRLAYRSQRVTALDRSHGRLQRLHWRLGAEYGYFEQTFPHRPKGMHRKTHERLTAELSEATERHDWIFTLAVAPLLARKPRLR
jgi:hypothetical protein